MAPILPSDVCGKMGDLHGCIKKRHMTRCEKHPDAVHSTYQQCVKCTAERKRAEREERESASAARVAVGRGTGRSKKGNKKKKRHARAASGSATYSCRTVWTSNEIAPSVVPKLSLANGLVYTYTKPRRADNVDAWFLTTLDFDDGRTVYRRRAGTSFGFNNNYAPVTLGPDGTAYVGVLGGVVAFSGP